jgi:hypothetical protein
MDNFHEIIINLVADKDERLVNHEGVICLTKFLVDFFKVFLKINLELIL